jgi:hypothetical protein
VPCQHGSHRISVFRPKFSFFKRVTILGGYISPCTCTNAIVCSHQNSYQAEKHQTVRSPGREFAEKCAHAYCSFTKLLHRRRPPWGSHMRCVQSASRLLNYVSARAGQKAFTQIENACPAPRDLLAHAVKSRFGTLASLKIIHMLTLFCDPKAEH